MLAAQQPKHRHGANRKAGQHKSDGIGHGQRALHRRIESIKQAGKRDAGENETDPVEWPLLQLGIRRHNARHQHQREDAKRQVDPEVPVPGGIFGEKSAQRWPQDGGKQRRPDGEPDGRDDLRFLGGPKHDDAPHRKQHRAARALQRPRHHELAEILRQPAGHRGDGEQGDGDEKDPPGTKTIGQPGRRRNADGHGQHVDGNANAHLERADAEIPRHLGQRGDDDHPIQHLGEEGGRHDERDVAGLRRKNSGHGRIVWQAATANGAAGSLGGKRYSATDRAGNRL